MASDKTFLSVLVSLFVLSAIFFVIERIAGRGRNRVQPVFRRGWSTDIGYWFMTVFVTKPLLRLMFILPVTVLILAQIAPVETFKMGAYTGYGPLSRQPVWLQVVQIYLLVDLIGYWTHRLFHRGRWWPFHAVHHSSEDLDWLGSLRVHPVNDLVNKFVQVSPVLLMGYNPTVTLTTAPILTFYAIFLHSNVNWDFGPLRSIIATPVFHRWHHSREPAAWDKNFAGLLPVWDILFGTYYMPRDRYPENFGICEPMPKGYLGQLWQPFTTIRRHGKKVDPK
jgi:sterol desaturase/sphingolipid hydroxylase (fatty acid hydroxylase superfamily)